MKRAARLSAMMPASLFEAWPLSARPQAARVDREFVTLQHARASIPPVHLRVDGNHFVWERGPNPTKRESAFARAAVHFSAEWPEETWAYLHRVRAAMALNPSSDGLTEMLRARLESGSATSVERAVLAACLPANAEFMQCSASIRLEELPRVGSAYALVQTRLGFGEAARDWMSSAPTHFRRAASAVLTMLSLDAPDFPQPRPLNKHRRVDWARELYGGPSTRDAVLTIREALASQELEPKQIHELIETCAPHAHLLVEALPESLATLTRCRLALWRGDAESALEELADDGSIQSAVTRIGAHCLLGDYHRALELYPAAARRSPDSQELALWRLQSLTLLDRRDEAEAASEEDQHLIGAHPVGRLLRALNGLDSLGPSEGRGSRRYFHRALIKQLIPDAALTDLTDAQELALAREALACFGGSRIPNPTVVSGDTLARPQLLEPRTEIIRIQHQLLTQGVADVKAALHEYNAGYPDVPFGPTYSAELDLFTGNYEEALSVFLESWETTGTRWSYVGAGAAYTLLGRHQEALDMFDRGEEDARGLIPGEATHAYRGEAMLRLGRLEEALPHLEYAHRVEPRRLGATLVLSELYRALGRESEASALLADVAARAPVLFAEASAIGGDDWAAKALEMMRGNRSSHLLTFYDRHERWRVIDLGHGESAMESLVPDLSPIAFADELWFVLPELAN